MGQAKSGLTNVANKYNIHLITSRRSYSLKDICLLFGVDRKTCSRWMDKGLKVIAPDTYPILIMGSDLKIFLQDTRSKRKAPLGEDELYCFKCHRPRRAKKGSEEVIKTGKRIGKEGREQLKKVGKCEVCGTELNRFMKVYQKD